MKYRFTRSIVHEGVKRNDGDVLDEAEFPDGSLGPCLAMGHVEPVAAESAPAPPPTPPTPPESEIPPEQAPPEVDQPAEEPPPPEKPGKKSK